MHSRVLPDLLGTGRQDSSGHTLKPLSALVKFEDILSVGPLASVLRNYGIHLVDSIKMPPCSIVCENTRPLQECQAKLRHMLHPACHIHIQAPFLHQIWDPAFLQQNVVLLNSLLDNLKPSEAVQTEVLTNVRELKKNQTTTCLSFIHARVENDWKEHCQSWIQTQGGSSTTCYSDMSEILASAKDFGLFDCDLYITYDADDIDLSLKAEISSLTERKDVKVHLSRPSKAALGRGREFQAAVQYFTAVHHADKFMGNTVSTLSAIITRQRHQHNSWSFQYNVGPVPLATVFPGFRFPWVFIARGSDKSYDTMLKIAVESALSETSLMPYALLHQSESEHPRTGWLRNKGVRLIFHTTDWDDKVRDILSRSSSAAKGTSHLYLDTEATLATYFRLDIGSIVELRQYPHILYTDTDIYFRKDITVIGTKIHLPETIQMGYEQVDEYPLNAGIFFASTRFLSDTHKELIQSLLSDTSISDARFGPGDQGILNRVYEKQLKLEGPLPKAFNAKPYHDFSSDAIIIHFHGPKLVDYAEYAINNHICRFDDLCRQGLSAGLCHYVKELTKYEAYGLITSKLRNALNDKCTGP